jgi:hypothetical protein
MESSFRTPEQVASLEQLHKQFISYIVPTITYDEYLKKFDLEFEPETLFSPHYGSAISLRFDSYEEVFSKKYKNRKVTISFYLSYGFVRPPEWMKSQVKDFKNKGEASAHLWYYDAPSGELITVEYLPPKQLPEFISFFKSHLQNDISFNDPGSGPKKPPEPAPTMPVVEDPKLELVNAWIKANCKFASRAIK